MKILDTEPKSIIAGQRVRWKKYLTDYPQKANQILIYYFCSNDSKFDVIAETKEDYYLINLPAEKTKDCKPDAYWWQAYIKQGEDLNLVDGGKLIIKPNLVLLETYDGRSHVKKVLDALDALVLGKASRDQMSYSISGRTLSRFTPTELLKWRDVYRAEYARELQQEKLAQGMAINNNIKVRFSQIQ